MQEPSKIFISSTTLEQLGFKRKGSTYTKEQTKITYDGLTWLLYKNEKQPIKITYLDEIK
jgi:hypothetical protein